MKTLIRIIAVVLPVLMFSQTTDSTTIAIKEAATAIVNEQRAIDSLKELRKKEVEKQIALLQKLQKKIDQLKKFRKLNSGAQLAAMQGNPPQAVRADSEAVYWEEVPRKWTGRLFNKEDTRIRLFRFEKGRKVYLN